MENKGEPICSKENLRPNLEDLEKKVDNNVLEAIRILALKNQKNILTSRTLMTLIHTGLIILPMTY
jgi:hypothetical protein